MNRSPLFIIGLNKIIGRTMRQLQLSTGYRREMLAIVIKWLNMARVDWREGFTEAAHHDLACAIEWLRVARNDALCRVMDA